MSNVNVNLTIGGRTFTVSATEGEESHVEMLARMIDERVKRVGGPPGQSEGRMLLYAALLLADELHEEHRKEPPPPAVQATPAPTSGLASAEVLVRVESLAARVEKLASHLEQAGVTP